MSVSPPCAPQLLREDFGVHAGRLAFLLDYRLPEDGHWVRHVLYGTPLDGRLLLVTARMPTGDESWIGTIDLMLDGIEIVD